MDKWVELEVRLGPAEPGMYDLEFVLRLPDSASDSRPLGAAGADRGVEDNVRLPVDAETGVVEDLVDVHRALQAVRTSDSAFLSPTFSFTSLYRSLEMLGLGEPSIR